jgi:hypothetical protein
MDGLNALNLINWFKLSGSPELRLPGAPNSPGRGVSASLGD